MTDQVFEFDEEPNPIVYVRSVKTADLPAKIQKATGDLVEVYAIHAEDGKYLAIAKDRNLAFELARENDFQPVSVH